MRDLSELLSDISGVIAGADPVVNKEREGAAGTSGLSAAFWRHRGEGCRRCRGLEAGPCGVGGPILLAYYK